MARPHLHNPPPAYDVLSTITYIEHSVSDSQQDHLVCKRKFHHGFETPTNQIRSWTHR